MATEHRLAVKPTGPSVRRPRLNQGQKDDLTAYRTGILGDDNARDEFFRAVKVLARQDPVLGGLPNSTFETTSGSKTMGTGDPGTTRQIELVEGQDFQVGGVPCFVFRPTPVGTALHEWSNLQLNEFGNVVADVIHAHVPGVGFEINLFEQEGQPEPAPVMS